MIEEDSYTTVSRTGEGQYVENRSRFLSFAIHVNAEPEIKSILISYRRKYYDARHICYAYVLGNYGETTRQNDDGEPSGTAGAPLARQLKSYGLTYTLLIVVRYFGGVKLGTSRLGIAYKTAAIEALENAERMECIVKRKFKISVPYADADVAMRFIRDIGADIINREYTSTDNVLTVDVRLKDEAFLRNRLSKILTLKFLKE